MGLYELVGGFLRWNTRVNAYLLGLTDLYPPFRLADNSSEDHPYPVQVEFAVPDRSNRFWAVPLLGILIKLIVLIPHLILLYVLGVVAGIVQLVLWIPVLFGGTYPGWGYELVGGFLRWSTRVYAYLFGLTDQYPPFRLGR